MNSVLNITFADGFNALEALWWLVMSAICWRYGRGQWKPVGRVSSVCFLLFSISDIIELQTGAWWRPWWLAFWKGLCLICLFGCGIWALRMKLHFVDSTRKGRSDE